MSDKFYNEPPAEYLAHLRGCN